MEKHYLTEQEKILVRREDNALFLLSHYSPEEVLATCFIEGNENTFLLPGDSALEDIWQGRLVAESWDNMGPTWFQKHDILGANHGSCFAFRIQILRHWLFEKDIGSILTDDAGNHFVLIAIDDLSTFVVHSDIPEEGKSFQREIQGALHINGRRLLPEKVIKTQIKNQPGGQLSPHQRYNSISVLAEGREPLSNHETVECSFVVLHWNMDLIFPEVYLKYLKANPGHYIPPTDSRLEGAIHYDMVTTFRPHGARTVDCDITYLTDISDSMRYGVLQFYGGMLFEKHERVMPGCKPIHCNGETIDLGKGYTFPKDFHASYVYTPEDAECPMRLPNRCIDFFGNGAKRELGVVLGYSETQGVTARGREAERGENLLYLYSSTKIYPFAVTRREMKKGETCHISAYQQYFMPDEWGISCYHHQRSDGYFVYVDFCSSRDSYAVRLPAGMVGRQVETVEKDDTIRLFSTKVPGDGVLLFKASGKGSIVLRIE